MPQSKKRVHHQPSQHQNNQAHEPKSRKPNNAVLVSVIFFGLLGLGISYFIGSGDSVWLAIGAIAGAVAGYLFGQQINKTVSKK